MATVAEAAKHIGISPRRLHDLITAGVTERQPRGGYDLDRVRADYTAYLRSTSGSDELAAAKVRKANADAERAELDLAERHGELVRVEEVEKRWNKIGTTLRTTLLALPSRLAPLVPGKTASQVEAIARAEVDDLLAVLSGGGRQ